MAQTSAQSKRSRAELARRLRRARSMPPRLLARRVADEARTAWYRVAEPHFARRFDAPALLNRLDAQSIDELWERLAARRHAADTSPRASAPNREQIEVRAAEARSRKVDLLGSGPVQLGSPIDWHTDFKSGFTWPLRRSHTIAYADLERANDVKVPWELSRLQWLLPVGQVYLLTASDRDAQFARDVIEEWLDANPYLHGINWACTMDVALRLVTLTWLFHVFAGSKPWSEPRFRERLLVSMYLHGRFVARNLERSDVNGNHFTADAAGLVAAGEFFGKAQWAETGWEELCAELPRQVSPDGVDFEMSTAYHRLVAELFLLATLFRIRAGKDVSADFRARLLAMADFAAAYSREETAPFWGDADDARALPFGTQPVENHSYLAGVIRAALGTGDSESEEAFWLLGQTGREVPTPSVSQAFVNGGVYILCGPHDHVFVDCGPVGLAGRGGHGHNDCLSFDAILDGTHLFTDCGSYLYTSSVEWRNRFRSTAFHNTPKVDGEEQNRFVSERDLWNLQFDAVPTVLEWSPGETTVFRGAHAGYERLADPVRVERAITLDAENHRLVVEDRFHGAGMHTVSVPYHLAAGVEFDGDHLVAPGRRFTFDVDGDWTLHAGDGWVSPSYGRKSRITRLELTRTGPLSPLRVTVQPVAR